MLQILVVVTPEYFRRFRGDRSTGGDYLKTAMRFQRWCHVALGILGVEVTVQGRVPRSGVLLIGNHVSYLDILVLGVACPVFFIPKSEIANWPFIGSLVRITRHIFITRQSKRDLTRVNRAMQDYFGMGLTVVPFLEGTSSSGADILPFRTGLLQPALEERYPIQPFAFDYSRSEPPLSVAEDIAYWRDMTFFPHFVRLAGLRGARVTIRFGDVVDEWDGTRVALSRKLRRDVRSLLFQDRPMPPDPVQDEAEE